MNRVWLIIGCIFLVYCQTVVSNSSSSEFQLDNSPDSLEIFAEGLISTEMNERDMAIAPDGDELIYTLANFDNSRRALVRIIRTENAWSSPEIMSFSGTYNDIEPFFSPDGQQLFFATDRPINPGEDRNDYNIWVAKKSGDLWTTPLPLDTLINSKMDEFYPAVAKNGNLYFTAAYPNAYGREDIYYSRFQNGQYLPPQPLDSTINSASYEFNAYISPEEDLLIFSSFGRSDGLGGGDLYYSRKDEVGGWKAAQNLGPGINSESLDYCPFVDLTHRNFYFSSNRSTPKPQRLENVDAFRREYKSTLNGLGNIFRVAMPTLFLE